MFDLAKEKEDSKTISLAIAEQIWGIYLKDRFQLYDKFIEYVGQIKDKKSINKDTWKMILEFNNVVGGDISKHKESDFWPTFIDNFAEFVKNG